MKKFLIGSILLSVLLVGCGETEDIGETKPTTGTSVSDSINQQLLGQEQPQVEAYAAVVKDYSALADIKADIDLTILNDTVMMAQVNNLMYMPQEYAGQTVKMKGAYMPFYSQQYDDTYHLMLSMDELMCCQGMVEFLLPEGRDYPEDGEEFMIFGEFTLMSDETGEYAIIIVSDYVI